MNYDELFLSPNGETSREHFIPAMITVLLVIAFYAFMVGGRNAQFCNLFLMYPMLVLLTRRLRDMGQPPEWVFLPLTLVVMTFDVQLGFFSYSESLDVLLYWVTIVVTGAFIVWGCVSPGKSSATSEF